MFPFTAAKQNKDSAQTKDSDEVVKSLEAMQGDKALISTVNELNELREDEDQLSEMN